MMNQFPQEWQELWQKEQFSTPSVIQERSFNLLKEGQSAILVSPTGTGKTLAYLWPLLLNVHPQGGNQLCIVLPSQELAMQVVDVARKWAGAIGIKVQAAIGGANIKRQIERLKKNPEVVIGTPGRLIELMNRRKVRADRLSMLVLDEADDLVSDEWNMTQVLLKKVQRDTQIVAVSATAHHMKETLYQSIPTPVEMLDVRHEDQSKGQVHHFYIDTPLRKRTDVLRHLAYVDGMRALVFFNTVQELGVVADKLSYEGINISTLASDQNKFERQISLKAFKEGRSQLLLTTDMASRGLDIDDLEVVIQYDVPQMTDSYVHRSGRVGRMGKEGVVISLTNDRERRNLQKMTTEMDATLRPLYVHHGGLHLEEATKPDKEQKKAKKAKKVKKKKKK